MLTLDFNKADIRLWKHGTGSLAASLDLPDLDQPIPPGSAFGLKVDGQLAVGSPGALELGVSAAAHAELFALWAEKDSPHKALLVEHGLAQYFEDHKDRFLLGLSLGAKAGASLTGAFRYAALSAQATLLAGADGACLYLRPFDRTATARSAVSELIRDLRLPAHLTTPPLPGEVLAFEYGGYLSLGAKVAAGYEMKGTPSIELGNLHLAEHCSFSLLGSLGLNAKVAGRFMIEARGMDGRSVNVIVRRSRSRELAVAADVNVVASSDLQGLPNSSDEFLGALLGVNTANWFNYLAEAGKLSSFDELEKVTDTLAWHFLGQLTGKAYDQIKAAADPVFAHLRKVIESYKQFDARAIALFDRYYDRIETFLVAQLEAIVHLDPKTGLKGSIDPGLASVIGTLTGGNPNDALGSVLAVTATDALKSAAEALLEKIREGAHQEILTAIRIAKQHFGADKLFAELEKIKTPEKLLEIAHDKLGGFVRRLIGQFVAKASRSELAGFFDRIFKILAAREKFQAKLYGAFTDAVRSRYTLALHATYHSSSEQAALLDIVIDLNHPDGWKLCGEACAGDFSSLFRDYNPAAVRIQDGAFTSRLARESVVSVNIMGWHDRFQYDGTDLYRVITETEQHVKTEPNGAISVHTTFSLQDEHERRSGLRGHEERLYTNLILRFIGESRKVLQYDARNRAFLIDAISSLSAAYQLSFSDARTTRQELAYYLSFAAELGLDAQGASLDRIEPLMPRDGEHYGAVTADYQVRFDKPALDALFVLPVTGEQIRKILRTIVLANYASERENSPWLADIGWCYWTRSIGEAWTKEGSASFENHPSGRTFANIDASPFPPPLRAPANVRLGGEHIRVLSTLYKIEASLVGAMLRLHALLDQATPMPPAEFAAALSHFGDALKQFDQFDQGANTIFALFDQIIRLSLPRGAGRASSLKLVSNVNGTELTKMFLAQPAEPVAATKGIGR